MLPFTSEAPTAPGPAAPLWSVAQACHAVASGRAGSGFCPRECEPVAGSLGAAGRARVFCSWWCRGAPPFGPTPVILVLWGLDAVTPHPVAPEWLGVDVAPGSR